MQSYGFTEREYGLPIFLATEYDFYHAWQREIRLNRSEQDTGFTRPGGAHLQGVLRRVLVRWTVLAAFRRLLAYTA